MAGRIWLKYPWMFQCSMFEKCWLAEIGIQNVKISLQKWELSRPRQLNNNWEYIMWKFQTFSTTQILCQINAGHFEVPKTTILTIWAALNFYFWELLTFLLSVTFKKKSKFNAFKVVKTPVFDLLTSAKIDFT